MAVYTHAIRYTPKDVPANSEKRVIFGNCDTDEIHCAVAADGHLGYYASGTFVPLGTKTIDYNETHSIIVKHDTVSGAGAIYLQGQKLGQVSNFPKSIVNQIGNAFTALYPSDDRFPSDTFFPRDEGNPYTLPANGDFDDYVGFERALAEDEIVDLAQNGLLSKVYTLADYKITAMADDNIIATTEKPRYSENWRSIWDADQRTTALPTAIGSITVNGSYKALANAANSAGVWTPTNSGTASYDYYQAVENWRQMYFVSSGGGAGFLLTAQLGVDTDISAMSPTLEARQSALMFAEDALRSAVMIKRQSTAELTAVANANAYTDELEDALRSQTDHAIVFTTSASDPSTSWTAEEKLIHKGDYWRVDASSAWKTWTGTTWGTVNDAQAQAAATLAQSVANGKTTLYGTLESAKLAAKTGDQFFYKSEIYVCTADFAATARRYTTKSYGNSATTPGQTTQTVAGSVLTEPLNFGDTYFNTTTKKFYTYTTFWVEDTATSNAVIAYAPKYLGRYYQSHPGAPNNGDWWLVYGVASSPVTRGFWYNNNGTNTLVSTLGTEAQRKYKGSGLEDVLYASNNGYALTSGGVYDPVAVYGVSVMEFLAVNQAFINKLVTQVLEFEESVSSIAGNTLVPRSGSTPGTQQIYMGKNPRYPNDASRAYEFALQEYLGMDGTKEVWMKHFWTRILASGVAALTLTGCVQANGGLLSNPCVSWKSLDLGTLADSSNVIQTIAYGDGRWMIGSYTGKLAYSIDGYTFTQITSPFGSATIYGIVYANGRWLMFSGDAKLAYSLNGTSFTIITNPFGAVNITEIAYGNGKWVITSIDGRVAFSANGTTFTLGTSPFGSTIITALAYGAGMWVAGDSSGRLGYSVDGQTFVLTTSPFSNVIHSIAYGNGSWVVGGSFGELGISSDGKAFTLIPSPFDTVVPMPIRLVHYNLGRWTIFGSGDYIGFSNNGCEFSSNNMSLPMGNSMNIYGIAMDDMGVAVCCGIGAMAPQYTSKGVVFRSDPLEAGGGVVGKVYDTAHGELNKLWDGRYFPSYESVDEIAPKKYFRFPAGTTFDTIFNALEPYVRGVGNHTSCLGTYGLVTPPALLKREASNNIRLYGTDPVILNDFIQGVTSTITADLTLEFIPVS